MASQPPGNGRQAPAPVLIVEDDPDLRKLLAQLLAVFARPVEAAGTGGEALAFVETTEPALVVLDVHLPDISGYEVCRELRDTFGEQLPILFVSGARTESYDRVGGLLLGADDYLVKPFAHDELLARVRRLLSRATRDDQERRYDLTARELEVLEHLAGGEDQARIADALVLSEKTVATHIQHILGKLGVHSRAEAVAFAHRRGISSGPQG